MRKILLIVIAALIISVAIYAGFGADSYILLRIGDWAMQVRLFVALLLLAGLVVVVWLCWSVFRGIFLGAWPAAWRRRRESNLTRGAIENLALSNWSSARKDLIRLANKAESPVPIILLSAQASESMGDFEEAKAVYVQTMEEFPEWSYTARVRLCNIALVEGNLEQAESMLEGLQNERKNDVQLQFLSARLAEEHRDWTSLQRILSAVAKKPQERAIVAPVERRFLQNRLLGRPGAPELLEFKDYVSGLDTVPSDIVAQLAQQLAMRGHAKEAEVLTRKILNRHWDESLVEVYAELEAQSPKKQLKNAETWLDSHRDSFALLNGLQKLAVRAGDATKADEYAARIDQWNADDAQPDKLERLSGPAA